MEVKHDTNGHWNGENWEWYEFDSLKELLQGRQIVNVRDDYLPEEEDHRWGQCVVLELTDNVKIIFTYSDHEGGRFLVLK